MKLSKYKMALFAAISTCTYASFSFGQYIGVVDAGSSGSRVHLYSVLNGKVIDITPKSAKAISPALANLSTDTVTVKNYAQSLTDVVTSAVDNGKPITPSEVNFYVYATAGMRLAKPSLADKLYPVLTQDLLSDGFASVSTKTVPEKMEGVFDWVALNYLKNTLSETNTNTFGVLDMGGASTEIAFATNETIPNPQDRVVITINKHSYQLYSRNYLGLGQDVARSQYTDDANCFPVGYPLPSGLNGTGRYVDCVRDMSPLINAIHRVSLPFLPNASQFYLISGFYYTGTDKPFNFTNGVMQLSQLAQRGENVCATPWSVLQTQYPNNAFLYSDCFNSAYYYALLTQGYHFGAQGGDQFHLENNINGADIDWTLGAALLLGQ